MQDGIPVKERIALVGWYFDDFMPLFVDMMFENRGNKDWLKQTSQIYQKEDCE